MSRAEATDYADIQRFLEAAPDALLVVGEDGRILWVNTKADELFGYARDELLGSPVEMLLPEPLRALHRGHRVAYHANPRSRAMGEGLDLLARRKDATEFPVDVSLGPVRAAAGTVVVAAVRDATERRRLEELSRRHAQDQLRRRQALELNDGVVQGLAAAGMALELGDVERAQELVASSLASARALVSQLLDELGGESGVGGGTLVRNDPAVVGRDPS